MPKLSLFLDEGGRASHELREKRITIGRAPDNLIEISDASVSGHHAQLLLLEGRYQLQDLGSTNGTRVNNENVSEVFLREGDRILFGRVEARFESDAIGPAQPLPEADRIEARPAPRSEKPEGFANASPFSQRQKRKDPRLIAVLAAAAVAALAFLIAMLGLFQMHGPR